MVMRSMLIGQLSAKVALAAAVGAGAAGAVGALSAHGTTQGRGGARGESSAPAVSPTTPAPVPGGSSASRPSASGPSAGGQATVRGAAAGQGTAQAAEPTGEPVPGTSTSRARTAVTASGGLRLTGGSTSATGLLGEVADRVRSAEARASAAVAQARAAATRLVGTAEGTAGAVSRQVLGAVDGALASSAAAGPGQLVVTGQGAGGVSAGTIG